MPSVPCHKGSRTVIFLVLRCLWSVEKVALYYRQFLRLKCTNFDLRWGFASDPALGELMALPQTLWLDLTRRKRSDGKGKEAERRKGKYEGRRRRERGNIRKKVREGHGVGRNTGTVRALPSLVSTLSAGRPALTESFPVWRGM